MSIIGKVSAGDALAGVHVLLLEDDQDALIAMQVNLEHAGAVVIGATTVRAALEALGQYSPDVILTDLKMPDEDGLLFVRELRRVTSMRGVPVLVVTGFQEFFRGRPGPPARPHEG